MHPLLTQALDTGAGVIDRRRHPDLKNHIDRALRSGDLAVVLPHALARPADAPLLTTRARAACLTYPAAGITGVTAGVRGGWSDLPEPEAVDVSTPRRQRPVAGFRFTERLVPRSVWRVVDGIRITTFPMTTLDLALEFGPDRLDAGLRRGVDPLKVQRRSR